jgi:ATP synthase protein I
LIPQKNQFSETEDWDNLEEEVVRVYSKEEIVALQQKKCCKLPNSFTLEGFVSPGPYYSH